MQGVVETKAYIAAAKDAGMSEEEMQAVVDAVAAKPQAGVVMPGCGGARSSASPERARESRAATASSPIMAAGIFPCSC